MSPQCSTIDWVGVMVIITSLHVTRHFVYAFAYFKNTYIPYDLLVYFPEVSNLKVWLRKNNKTS
jgi:hypothetical protein